MCRRPPDAEVTRRHHASFVRGRDRGGIRPVLPSPPQLHQEQLPASGSGTVVRRTTASLAAYVRAEVRHPRADGTPGKGNTMGPDLQWGPTAALTNPDFLGRRRG